MKYSLHSLPQLEYWSETRVFMISIDDQDPVRVKTVDTPNNTAVYVLKNDEWEITTDENLLEWVNNQLPAEEFKLYIKLREETQIEKENEKVIDYNIGIADTIDPSPEG